MYLFLLFISLDARCLPIHVADQMISEQDGNPHEKAHWLKNKKRNGRMKRIEEEKERRFAEARNQANGEYERLMEQARKESDRIIATAKKEAEEERQIRLRKANQEITDLVAQAAERIVTADQSDDMNKELYDRFLEQAK